MTTLLVIMRKSKDFCISEKMQKSRVASFRDSLSKIKKQKSDSEQKLKSTSTTDHLSYALIPCP
jgi:hypothetical protein